jgi:hypothetical protein
VVFRICEHCPEFILVSVTHVDRIKGEHSKVLAAFKVQSKHLLVVDEPESVELWLVLTR